MPPVSLDLIALYRKPSQLRDWLTCYKGRTDGTEPLVASYADIVKAMLARFLHDHGDRLAARSPIDCITVVPSSERPGLHPLHALLNELPLSVPVTTLLQRGPGELAHTKASRDGYIHIGRPLAPQRVLLVDDVFTTGARVNSAAHALAAAGHQLAGTLIIARRVNPDYNEHSAAFWERQTAQKFSWQASPVIN
ncbi:amidophosphoribosyltransferase [Mycobacteroides abscessus]|uniref:amidophosphoribosyltransferase n=1 Tax=Mycobacteroides abscessus TaxID=36809 RepID=UPI000C262EBB|nr:amidophosphoribosyltransferase [Mycobacteroides abscessus]